MTLSIIIALFNEEARLAKTKKFVGEFLCSQRLFDGVEVVLVSDGSTDKTVEIIKTFSKDFPVSVLGYKNNKGKGHAVRVGMERALGDYALFLDADMSAIPHEVEKFMHEMRRGTPVIIGTRKSKDNATIISQPVYRMFMGRVFNMLANWFVWMTLSDFNCGFKCFSREAREKIFPKCLIDRWLFDVELLFLAKLLGLKIVEVPIVWKNDPKTTIKLKRDVFQSLFDLLRIRWNYITGKYDFH